jgi:hypothetical protein
MSADCEVQASLRDAINREGGYPPVNWRAIVSGPYGTRRGTQGFEIIAGTP